MSEIYLHTGPRSFDGVPYRPRPVEQRGAAMSRQSALLIGSALLLLAAGPVSWGATADVDDNESLAAHESEETSRMIRAELPK